jgi:hypothetical protein
MPAAEVFIQATETDPDVIARGAVRDGLHPRQQPRPKTVAPGVRSNVPRRLQLGLSAGRARGVASTDRPGRC